MTGPADDASSIEPEVHPVDATAMISEGALVLDVREDEEWAAGHVAGAVHVPLATLSERLDELDHDRKVVCVCRSGGRSSVAAAALRREGYDVWNLLGGMTAWVSDGLPLVDENGDPGLVA